jgi:hypothetical protein
LIPFPHSLSYVAKGRAIAVPSWANFFYGLGAEVFSSTTENRRAEIVAISLPSRAFASVFTALGCVTHIVEHASRPISENLFEQLKHSCGTVVAYVRTINNQRVLVRGVVDGTVRWRGQERLKVLRESRDGYRAWDHLDKDECHGIVVTDENANPAAVQTRLAVEVSQHSGFIDAWFGSNGETRQLAARPGAVCVIDDATALKEELFGTTFRCDGVTGNLGALIRPSFATDFARHILTHIVSTRHGPSEEHCSATYEVAIIVGGRAYLRWSRLFKKTPIIVLLDRTDSTFRGAVEDLNLRFYTRAADWNLNSLSEIPRSAVFTSFEE